MKKSEGARGPIDKSKAKPVDKSKAKPVDKSKTKPAKKPEGWNVTGARAASLLKKR